jgi:hypothetical protein
MEAKAAQILAEKVEQHKQSVARAKVEVDGQVRVEKRGIRPKKNTTRAWLPIVHAITRIVGEKSGGSAERKAPQTIFCEQRRVLENERRRLEEERARWLEEERRKLAAQMDEKYEAERLRLSREAIAKGLLGDAEQQVVDDEHLP